MKVFLLKRETGQYYTGPNAWTRRRTAAHDFETVESAAQLARTEKLEGMEVVFHYGDHGGDLALPLKPEP